MSERHVVVVGASLAGSAAAMLLAREGARVTLIEKAPDPAHFKRVCGHFIQASAIPTLGRLGLLDELVAAGGVRSRARIRTRWGWNASDAVPASLNIRRETMDPVVRGRAAATPGVTLLAGRTVSGVVRDGDGAVCGVELRDGGTLAADLVVGADGRDSAIAKLAGVPEKTSPHGRFAYAAYYEGPLPAGAPDGTLWFLDPNWAAAFPTDDGLVQYAVMPAHEHLPEFKADPEAALERFIAALPDAPPMAESRRVSPVMGKIDMTNRMRRPAMPGLALVGDAAYAADPVYGVGCGWAFQTAEWLADAVAPWVHGEQSLERGLRRYRRRHGLRLGPHAQMLNDYATGRRFNPLERRLYPAAVRDRKVAARMARVGIREASPLSIMRPGTLARIAWANRPGRSDPAYSRTTRTSPSLTA